MCSNCKEKPRATQDDPRNTLCGECKYEKQKRWMMNTEQQKRNEAFIEGVNAMRNYLSNAFRKYDPRIQRFGGPEIAQIIQRVPAPAIPPPLLPGRTIS